MARSAFVTSAQSYRQRALVRVDNRRVIKRGHCPRRQQAIVHSTSRARVMTQADAPSATAYGEVS